MTQLQRFLILFSLFCLSNCELGSSVPQGRIRIKNDSQDKNFNILQVYGGGASFALKPGESKMLPAGTNSFSFSREYQDFTRNYSVECPNFNAGSKGITVKMIDVHTNRIGGGCKTVSAGKS